MALRSLLAGLPSAHTLLLLGAFFGAVSGRSESGHVSGEDRVDSAPVSRSFTSSSVGQIENLGQRNSGGAARGVGGQAQAAEGGAANAAGGEGYKANALTKELAKAAEPFQKQIQEAEKNAIENFKKSTETFVNNLDKLKVPEPESLVPQIAKAAESFKTDTKALSTAVDGIIDATQKIAETRIQRLKAIAVQLAPNDKDPPPMRPQMPTMADRISAFTGGQTRGPASNPMDLAMGADPSQGGADLPSLARSTPPQGGLQHGGGLSTQRAFHPGTYNPPRGLKAFGP